MSAMVVFGKQVETRSMRDLLGEHLHPRRGRVGCAAATLEIEPVALGHDHFAIEHAPVGQLRLQRVDELGKYRFSDFSSRLG